MTATGAREKVSGLIHSGDFYDETDDTEKDEDNGSWIMQLPPGPRDAWVTTLEWIRTPDRFLEHHLFDDGAAAPGYGFSEFVDDWRRLGTGRHPEPSPCRDLFERLREQMAAGVLSEADLGAGDLYLDSLWRYRAPRLSTIEDYRQALYGLSGSFFMAFPFKPPGLLAEIGVFGTLDQFFNNLRDLSEDLQRGICYYPAELLGMFDIERDEIFTLVERSDVRFVRMNEHLLTTLVPQLQREASSLFSAGGLHHSWTELLRNCLMRHSRIEYVARLARFNPSEFRRLYWPIVRRDFRHDETRPVPVTSRLT